MIWNTRGGYSGLTSTGEHHVNSHCFEPSLILAFTHPSTNQMDSDCRSSALLQTCYSWGYLACVKDLIQKEMGSTVSSFHIFQFSKQTKCSCVLQVLGETGISQAEALLHNLYCLMNHCWLSKLGYLSSVLPSHPYWLKFWWLSIGFMITLSDSNPKPFETVSCPQIVLLNLFHRFMDLILKILKF